MKSLGTLLLLVAVALVGGYLWMNPDEKDGLDATLAERATSRREGTPAKRLVDFDLEGITAVELVDAATTVRRDRKGPTWGTDSDDRAVVDFLENLNGLGRLQEFEAGAADAAEYGFGETSRRRIRLFTSDGGVAAVIALGARNPAGTGLYAKVGDEPGVILAGALLDWEFEKLFRRSMPTPPPETTRP